MCQLLRIRKKESVSLEPVNLSNGDFWSLCLFPVFGGWKSPGYKVRNFKEDWWAQRAREAR